jgi:hypothetical protein
VAWRGAALEVFWGYGVMTSVIIATIYAAAIYTAHMALQQVLLLCFLLTHFGFLSQYGDAPKILRKGFGVSLLAS